MEGGGSQANGCDALWKLCLCNIKSLPNPGLKTPLMKPTRLTDLNRPSRIAHRLVSSCCKLSGESCQISKVALNLPRLKTQFTCDEIALFLTLFAQQQGALVVCFWRRSELRVSPFCPFLLNNDNSHAAKHLCCRDAGLVIVCSELFESPAKRLSLLTWRDGFNGSSWSWRNLKPSWSRPCLWTANSSFCEILW